MGWESRAAVFQFGLLTPTLIPKPFARPGTKPWAGELRVRESHHATPPLALVDLQ